MSIISEKDKLILRELGKKQMEYANTKENKEREKQWYLFNDLKSDKPMVTIEEGTFYHEVERPLVCETEKGREFEWQLMYHIIGREDIDDDRATPDYFGVTRQSWFLPFGLKPETRGIKGSVAYEFVHVIHDLEKDMHKLGPSKWGFSKNIEEDLNLARDIFDGIMPIKELSSFPEAGLTYRLVNYMSLQTMMYSMYDYPELFHQMMDRLSEDFLKFFKEQEQAGFYITNNQNQHMSQGTCAAHTQFEHKDGATLKEMWGYFDSQETSEVSPEMFTEMLFPYYRRLMDEVGLINWGCCEPVHGLWEPCLSKLKNLRKVSIAPWCDEEYIGDKLRGTGVIYHRKPSPNLLGEKGGFNDEAFKEHILKTLRAAKGCKLEFSLRDIYTTGGEKGRAMHVVKLIKNLIDTHWE